MEKKKKFQIPHVYVLLTLLVVIAFAATFIIPSGSYERMEDPETKRTVVVNDSFQYEEKTYLSAMDLPLSIVEGMKKASNIIFFVLIIGGAFQIITASGVFNALTLKIAKTFGHREQLVIPIFLLFFSVLGFTMGASQEVMIFIPIGVAIARALGYDAITGVAMMMLGGMCGFTAGIFNPFNVGVAQSIAQVPIYSGAWYRVIILIVFLIITGFYVLRYAAKIKANPTLSYCRDLELEEMGSGVEKDEESLNSRHVIILMLLIGTMGLIVWGIKEKNWFIDEMSALFLVLGIVSGFVARMNASKIADEFVVGAKSLTFGALIIGLASAISVVLIKGGVLDTIIYGLVNVVSLMPRPLQPIGLFFSQVAINFFIISGTGQAAVVMPILTPLADLLNISRQTMVLAFQLGDGYTNYVFPTAGTLMSILSVAKVKYEQWFKFVWPLMLYITVISAALVWIADLIGY